MKKIILLGYMGSGKSTVGKKLAQVHQLEHRDLDEIIEKREGNSISEIFSQRGELYFRKQEHLYFKEQLDSSERFVLSLGGGTPCYAQNHLFLQNENVVSIYLKTPIATLVNRIKNSAHIRPLLQNKNTEELSEYVAKHLFDRSFFYHQARYVVNTDGKSVDQLVTEIGSYFDK